jgi:hypothetical protein
MKIFLANLVVNPHHSRFEYRPEAPDPSRVNRANHVLANGVVDRLARETMLQTAVAGIGVAAEEANALRNGLADKSLQRIPISP